MKKDTNSNQSKNQELVVMKMSASEILFACTYPQKELIHYALGSLDKVKTIELKKLLQENRMLFEIAEGISSVVVEGKCKNIDEAVEYLSRNYGLNL